MKTRTLAALALSAVTALALSACTGGVTGGVGATPTPSSAPSAPLPDPEPLPTEEPEPVPEPEAQPTLTPAPGFGETFTYENGVEVTLSKPTKIKLPDYYDSFEQAGIEGDAKSTHLLKFEVKVANKSAEVLDPSWVTTDVLVGEDGNPVDAQCFTDIVTCSADQDKLNPGRSITLSWAYAIPKAKANLITVEVSPGIEYDSAVFEGAVK